MAGIKSKLLADFTSILKSLNESDKEGDAKVLRGFALMFEGSLAMGSRGASAAAESAGFSDGDSGGFDDGSGGDDGGFSDGDESGGGDFDGGDDSGGFDDGDSGGFDDGDSSGDESGGGDFDDGDSGGFDDGDSSGGDFDDGSSDEPSFEEEKPKPSRSKAGGSADSEETYGGKNAKELVAALKANGIPGSKLEKIWKDKGGAKGIVAFAKYIDGISTAWVAFFKKGPLAKVESYAKKKGVEVKYGPGRKSDETKIAKIADLLAAKGLKPE